VAYFIRLGLLGFGGPVALVDQMERELVADRGWLSKDEMREAIAICRSLPGPLAIHIAYLRGGFPGAWAGGSAFILPNFLIVAALGALCVHPGDLPAVTAIFYGVSPAVFALILHSFCRPAKLSMDDRVQWGIAAVCFIVTVNLRAEVALLFIGAGIAGILYYGRLGRLPPARMPEHRCCAVLAQLAPGASGATLVKLLPFFLKAGSLTFGSGLVIVPFLEQCLVQQYGWLDPRQFLITVAVGMISPGPVVITPLRGLPRGGLLGFARFHGRHLPAVVHSGTGRRPAPCELPRKRQCAGLRERCLRSRDWNDPRRLRSARPNCDRRLADGSRRPRIACRAVPVEGQRSAAHCRDGSGGSRRLSAAAAQLGHAEIIHRLTAGHDRFLAQSGGRTDAAPRLQLT
jgi:putative chromate ion transporter